MLRTSQNIVRNPPLKEADDDGTNTKTLSTDVGHEIRRNFSTETHSTDYSSGIHSLDLLMEIYQSISYSESEHGEYQEEVNDNNTVVHINYSKENTKSEFQKEEVVNDNLSFFSLVSDRGMTSQWFEDKPFDEESLRALSERGDDPKNVYSKNFDRTEEYILPPVNLPEKIVRISADKEPHGNMTKPSTNTLSASPMISTLPSEYENQEESDFQQPGKETNERSNKRVGVSRKFFWIACISVISLLAVAILLGFLTSRMINENNASGNQATAASSDLSESEEGVNEDSPRPPTNTSDEPGADERPWGNLITYLDPIPESFFPLGLCAGDCDRDADCAEGLICYQRGANDPVPFCYYGENDDSRTDYCTYPTFSGEMPGSESDECITRIAVVQKCVLETDNVMVTTFENCSPEELASMRLFWS